MTQLDQVSCDQSTGMKASVQTRQSPKILKGCGEGRGMHHWQRIFMAGKAVTTSLERQTICFSEGDCNIDAVFIRVIIAKILVHTSISAARWVMFEIPECWNISASSWKTGKQRQQVVFNINKIRQSQRSFHFTVDRFVGDCCKHFCICPSDYREIRFKPKTTHPKIVFLIWLMMFCHFGYVCRWYFMVHFLFEKCHHAWFIILWERAEKYHTATRLRYFFRAWAWK